MEEMKEKKLHGHGHDHEHCCDHEHEHHHEHEHEQCCGHEHDHEHEHEHEHCCGHEHDHDHEHHHEHHQEAVSVAEHDGAAVGTVKIPITLPLMEAMDDIRKRVDRIAVQIEEAGGFIGHIKGIVQEQGPKCRFSLVEAEGGLEVERIEQPCESEVECVFIVFNVETHQLRELLEKEFNR